MGLGYLLRSQRSGRKISRFVAFGDVHSEPKYVRAILPFIREFRPDFLIIGGDFVDLETISRFNKHRRGLIGIDKCLKDIKAEIATCNSILDEIDVAAGEDCRKVLILGNHEERLDKFYCEYPQYHDEGVEIQSELMLQKRGYKVVGHGGFYKLGKLYFIHGEGYGGDHYTKSISLRCRRNIRTFHHHTNQTYTITSPLDSGDICEVKSIGCMCDRAPSYLRGTTNRWINSFGCGYVKSNGDFQDYVVNIVGMSFIAPNGKLYEAKG